MVSEDDLNPFGWKFRVEHVGISISKQYLVFS